MTVRVRHGLLLTPGVIFAAVMLLGSETLELTGWRLWALPCGCAVPIGVYLWLERASLRLGLRWRLKR